MLALTCLSETAASHCRDFHEIFDISAILEHLSKKLVSLKSDKNNRYLHHGLCTFVIISRSVRLKMRNVSDKSCRLNQSTHCVFSNFFAPEYRCVYEIMWQHIVQPDRPQTTIWRMRIAHWITKATNTHS
jgi:preprotein translocase subunit Sec63